MNDKKRSLSYIIMLIICFLFLILGCIFVYFMMRQNEKNDLNNLYDLAAQEKTMILKQINGDWETLSGISICLGDLNITETDQLTPILTTINNANTFIRMGFINTEGIGDLIDINGNTYEHVDFSNDSFFQEALAGHNSISEAIEDPYSIGYINYYGVPVYQSEKVIGVLCAVNSTDILRNIVDATLIQGGGFSNILKSNGQYIIRSAHHYNVDNIYKLADLGDFSKEAYANILSDFAAGSENTVRYNYKGNKYWAVYIPVDVNDWYIISIVPESIINGNYNYTLGVILIVSSAFIISMVFAYRMNQMTRKNKEHLEQLAYSDPITGYSSFVKFLLDIGSPHDHRQNSNYAFWYCDIKRFKYFNDLFGYDAGDEVLKYFANMISRHTLKNEFFCRVNADNFTGLKYYNEKSELVEWFQTLNEQMNHYITSENQEYHLDLSIGIYCVNDFKDDITFNDMINRANMAQKAMKQSGSDNYAFYSQDIRKQILMETEMESRMHQALENEEFKIFVQPKVDIQHGNRIAGGEVLVRWVSGQGSLVVPGKFIPLFEKNGFIIHLDRYMFEGICKWARGYLDAGNPKIKLATNVSRLGLFQDDFLDFYINTKNKYHLPDGMLELEFTESVVLNNNELFKTFVEALQENGFVCSLDDFGSGYSSLNVLKELPIQVLKLDMIFFRKGANTEREQIVIRNIITMAKQLKMRTVSEGVEMKEQVNFLREVGCDIVQGYVFAKPMPLPQFEQLLKDKTDGFQL